MLITGSVLLRISMPHLGPGSSTLSLSVSDQHEGDEDDGRSWHAAPALHPRTLRSPPPTGSSQVISCRGAVRRLDHALQLVLRLERHSEFLDCKRSKCDIYRFTKSCVLHTETPRAPAFSSLRSGFNRSMSMLQREPGGLRRSHRCLRGVCTNLALALSLSLSLSPRGVRGTAVLVVLR